ncbi:hypothetical protein PLESTB_001237200 [Pleodorina starrii]|uniref:Wax synthase domain-containing protein n=1 Tax=Pleodorina starrii TaxID=330485 RepID=A0A9W6BSE9_9CHLO|nr:hypothetical protein PLESTB_001237200 [Pleodorina starrii]
MLSVAGADDRLLLTYLITGAYFAIYLRAIEYCVLEDPCPSPRSKWQYFLAALRDSYLPFEKGAVAGRASLGQAPAQLQQPQRPGPGPKHSHLERQPLAAAGSSYPAAVARLLFEVALQYIVYDSLLTLCVKPLSGAAVAGSGSGALTLFSAASLQASASFAVCLYLHFAISNKCIVLALSLAQPGLLYRCRHLFREPWRGLLSVSELWQRWHQLFRMTFVRLAYRPARAGVRRLLGAGPRAGGAGANDDSDPAAKGDGKAARRGGGGAAIVAEGVALFAVFLLSGVIHEYMCWAAFGAARGWQLLFFLSHAAAILVEQAAAAAIARRSVPRGGAPLGPVLPGVLRGAMGAASAVFCVLSSVAFMRPWLEAGYYRDIWHPVSPVGWAMQRLGGER